MPPEYSIFGILISFSLYASHDEKVLIISSYTADSKRVTDFVSELEKVMNKKDYSYQFALENMAVRGLNECNEWSGILKSILQKYETSDLLGVILIGQEAWSTYLGLESIPDVPFYVCYASRYGIVIPEGLQDVLSWEPECVNTQERALLRGNAGGLLNDYDLVANVRLIRLIYPSIRNIALITDNTYGGVSLRTASVQAMKDSFPDMNLRLLDARTQTTDELKQAIRRLPDNTAIVVGCWRVDKNGSFFIQSSLRNIIPEGSYPVFSLTGEGMSSVAMGGYMPNYESIDIEVIADDLNSVQHGRLLACKALTLVRQGRVSLEYR